MESDFKLQPGDILVNINDRHNPYHSLKRWLIGEYDHVFAYLGKQKLSLADYPGYDSKVEVPMIVESCGRGVCLRSLSERYGNKVVVMRLLPQYQTIEELLKINWNAIELASSEQAYYDYLAIVQYVIPQALLEKLHLETLIPISWHNNVIYICSEAIFEIFYRSGIRNILPKSTGIKNYEVIMNFLKTISASISGINGKYIYFKIPMPGDFVESPCLQRVYQGIVSPDWF